MGRAVNNRGGLGYCASGLRVNALVITWVGFVIPFPILPSSAFYIIPYIVSTTTRMSSPNPFTSSPASSGYATAERFSSPPSISYGWAEPLYGDEVFPPRLTHDEFAIVNPDFWDHNADKDKFSGWM